MIGLFWGTFSLNDKRKRERKRVSNFFPRIHNNFQSVDLLHNRSIWTDPISKQTISIQCCTKRGEVFGNLKLDNKTDVFLVSDPNCLSNS